MNRKILVTVVLFLVVALSKGQTFEDLTCNYICPDNYEPVCGFNGEEYEEFATECELKNANCLLGRDKAKAFKIVKTVLCDKMKPKNECLMRPCPLILKPICAFDGKVQRVFDNQCAMEIQNCISGNDILDKNDFPGNSVAIYVCLEAWIVKLRFR